MARLKVRCVDNRPYLREDPDGVLRTALIEGEMISLTRGQVYEVMDADEEFYRIVDDTGEDYLYPKELFAPIE